MTREELEAVTRRGIREFERIVRLARCSYAVRVASGSSAPEWNLYDVDGVFVQFWSEHHNGTLPKRIKVRRSGASLQTVEVRAADPGA